MSVIGMVPCTWTGYLGGARYHDAACSQGEIVDLDDCEVPGGPCGVVGEQCPNCGGSGLVEEKHVNVGPMALCRQRAHDSLIDDLEQLIEIETKDERLEWLRHIQKTHVTPIFALINKLEGRGNA